MLGVLMCFGTLGLWKCACGGRKYVQHDDCIYVCVHVCFCGLTQPLPECKVHDGHERCSSSSSSSSSTLKAERVVRNRHSPQSSIDPEGLPSRCIDPREGCCPLVSLLCTIMEERMLWPRKGMMNPL